MITIVEYQLHTKIKKYDKRIITEESERYPQFGYFSDFSIASVLWSVVP